MNTKISLSRVIEVLRKYNINNDQLKQITQELLPRERNSYSRERSPSSLSNTSSKKGLRGFKKQYFLSNRVAQFLNLPNSYKMTRPELAKSLWVKWKATHPTDASSDSEGGEVSIESIECNNREKSKIEKLVELNSYKLQCKSEGVEPQKPSFQFFMSRITRLNLLISEPELAKAN